VPLFEYRSKLELFGLPLVHLRLRAGIERGPVKAWIAAGDAAVGVIFAFGGVAVAPISFGGFAVGVFALGGFAVGLMPCGGFSLGPWALGGFAVGWRPLAAVRWAGRRLRGRWRFPVGSRKVPWPWRPTPTIPLPTHSSGAAVSSKASRS